MKSSLILLRHGQSLFNKKNIFTGWVDVSLSSQGVKEAQEAGKSLKNHLIDEVHTSTLIRAQMTTFLALDGQGSAKIPVIIHKKDSKQGDWGQVYNPEMQKQILPVYCDSCLNERMYGNLQGKNKEEVSKEFGKPQVHLWRRSYDVQPPGGESLKDNTERTIPYFQKNILPSLQKGKNVLIAAHGNSLRAIIKFLENLSEKEILEVEVPTGKPLFYTYCNNTFQKELLE